MVEFSSGRTTVEEQKSGNVTRYAFDGTRVYRMDVESFPGHVTNMYLILDQKASLVDLAFNGPKAAADLLRGFQTINTEFAERVSIGDISDIVITHGHGDHFGMLEFDALKGKKSRVYIHPLDSRIIRDYHGVYLDWKDAMAELLREAGHVMDVQYLFPTDTLDYDQDDYEVIEIEDGDTIVNGYEVCHTPGHSLGQICLKVGPVVFLGDHMLSLTTPHQVPLSTWQGAGLTSYLASLQKVTRLGVDLGLPAHEDTIYPVSARAREIEAFHYRRLDELEELCDKERTLYELTDIYYRRHPELIQATCLDEMVVGDVLLALEEIKAHIEVMLEQGRVHVSSARDGVPRYLSS